MTEKLNDSLNELEEQDEILAADIEMHDLKLKDEQLLAATLQGTLAIVAYQLERAERDENDERQLLRGKEPTDRAPIRQKVYLFDPQTYAFNMLSTVDGTSDNDTLTISEALSPRRTEPGEDSEPEPIVWPNSVDNQRYMELDGRGNITSGEPVDSVALEAWNGVLARSIPIDGVTYHRGARLYLGRESFSPEEHQEVEQGLAAAVDRVTKEIETHGIA